MSTMSTELVEVTVDVTQEDIDAGHRFDCDLCPIAVAMDRMLKDGFRSAVSNVHFEIHRHDGVSPPFANKLPVVAHDVILPVVAHDFICDFDGGHGIASPFSFTTHLPKEVLA
jgi:hypothetical protein